MINFWEEYDRVRCNLLRFIREETRKINWCDFPKEEKKGKLKEIHSKLIDFWKKEYEKLKKWENELWLMAKGNGWTRSEPGYLALDGIKGALYEALFYFTWFCVSVYAKALEILRIGGIKIEKVDRFEILPISGPLGIMFRKGGKRFAPQIDADYILIFSSENEVHRPIFIDVKSSEPAMLEEWERERILWQAKSCAYMDSTFQIWWPKKEYPEKIED